ncbi:myosin heavy chain, putative [Schistosoma mansoni]|nr:myosin heavy chain, putative [Schistosoma mansoni]|eukprot:XP_018646976.1 myosin heavy chain, putative [Schistosoma mansoni]
MDPSDPDFKYLGVDRKALLKELANFDSKNVIWVEDEKEGYVLADIKELRVLSPKKTTCFSLSTWTVSQPSHKSNTNIYEFEQINLLCILFLTPKSITIKLLSFYILLIKKTYSGLFCVAVNPYKRFPIYTEQVALKYKGKRRGEMPPHIFSISDNAYHNMLQDRENQSILITGESGAGKTENTKKVISYFAVVAAASKKEDDDSSKKGTLEDQIVQANPVLEAYGNAKTTRNNNSSRFGKFIRIHFGTTGKIAGADIEHYLLEKSRVVSQMKGERNYHIFYQLLSTYGSKYHDKLLVQTDPALYSFINQGELTIDGVDDSEEMKLCDEAFEVLGFNDDEKLSLFKCTTSICNMGEMKFKQRPREEQAEADGTAEAEKVAFLLGVNAKDLLTSFLKPKVKVGTEFVTKGQNLNQVTYAVSALAKSLYNRMFGWLVARVNKTLDTKVKRQFFIGVLDIAGFEIFTENGFEQICINYTNERLQQFFNHHMFVLEQEEYKREKIQWTFIDFGMDLQACIDLIEKPMGILSILEEECIVPKASDQTFLSKLYDNHLGKSPNFTKPKPPKPGHVEAHFELHHYAGSVPYTITGWLEKNKDPLNDSVVALLGDSKDPLVSNLFTPVVGEPGKKTKGGSFLTVTYMHRESLNKLMKNLQSTSPSFIRCIVPNEFKQPDNISFYTITIHLTFNEFSKKRKVNHIIIGHYSILAPNVIPDGFVDGRQVTEKILEATQLDKNLYQCGNTKVFFKAGTLAHLEDLRDDKLNGIISLFQAEIRGYLMRKQYKKLQDQRVALTLMQRNIRKYLVLRNWPWWRLYTKVKPMLNIARQEEEMKKAAEELAKLKEEYEKLEKLKKELEEQNVTVLQQKNDLFLQLQTEQDSLADAEEKISKLVLQRGDMEQRIKELEERLADEEDQAANLTEVKKKMSAEIEELKKDVEDLESSLQKAEQEKQTKDNQIRTLQSEMAQQDEMIGKLNKDKKNLEEQNKRTQEALQAEEDKVNHLNKLKAKLESTLDEMEENLAREQKIRGDVEKSKRKLEGDLKATQETVDDLERVKRDLEEQLRRKEAEIGGLSGKFEDEQGLVAQLQRKIKELQTRIQELEEDLEAERAARSKAEKSRQQLESELEEVVDRLEEQDGATAAQSDLTKKREAELMKLKRDLEDTRLQNEQAIATMRKKQSDAINELADQLDQANKAKAK